MQRDHLKKINSKSDQNIHQIAHFFEVFSLGSMTLSCVQLISLFLYESGHFSFKKLSKRINYVFQKVFPELYQPHSKRVAITINFLSNICSFLENFSRHNLIKYTPKRTKLHHISKIFSSNEIFYMPQSP